MSPRSTGKPPRYAFRRMPRPCTTRPHAPLPLLAGVLLASVLAACGGGDGASSTAGAAGAPASAAPANRAPSIQGTPPTTAVSGQPWAFVPTASDPDGDPLTFSVTNRPAWASFDAQTGRLAGTPGTVDQGAVRDVTIAVTDGRTSTALAPFTITVALPAAGATTLSWEAPLTNTDGSALADLAGFRIAYGTVESNLTRSIDVPDPAASSRRIEGLAPGLWYFAVIAYNRDGVEGLPSAVASTQIR